MEYHFFQKELIAESANVVQFLRQYASQAHQRVNADIANGLDRLADKVAGSVYDDVHLSMLTSGEREAPEAILGNVRLSVCLSVLF